MLYNFAAITSLIIFKCFFNLKVEGKDCLPKKSPFILAANHISNLDPFVVGSCIFPTRVNFLAKEELFYNKFNSFIFKDFGAIPLKRGTADIGALRSGLRALKIKPLVVFPQGRRMENLDKVNMGVGFLCKKARVPVAVARIYGTEKSLSRVQERFRLCKIRVVFGRVDNIEESDDYRAIAFKVRDKIKSL